MSYWHVATPLQNASKILPPPWTLTSNLKQTFSFSKWKPRNSKKKFKYDYYILWGPSFISVVVFSIGYILLRVQLSKNITKCLSFMIIQTYSTHFTINFFIWATWKRKQTIEQQLQHACERTISKQNQVTLHLNWPRVLLFDLQ